MKKRDFTILGLLMCLVAYAACTRISETPDKTAQKIKCTTTAKLNSPVSPTKNKDFPGQPAIRTKSAALSQYGSIAIRKNGGPDVRDVVQNN